MIEFLRGRFGPDADIKAMRPGAWSAVYAVRAPDVDLVARFSAYDEDFEKDAHVAQHSATALPIPPIIDWGPGPGGFFALAPRVSGEHLDGLDETRMRRVLPSLLRSLDAMREIDLSQASGFGGWRAPGRAPHSTWCDAVLAVRDDTNPRVGGWRALLAGSSTGMGPFEEGYARMRALLERCPEERHLIHDDLINRNVLVAGDRVSAVLDWGSSLYGDFLYDLGKFEFYKPWFPAWRRIDFALEARAHYEAIGVAVPHFRERLTCYALRVGLADMGYCAFRQRWDDVAANARRVLELARAG